MKIFWANYFRNIFAGGGGGVFTKTGIANRNKFNRKNTGKSEQIGVTPFCRPRQSGATPFALLSPPSFLSPNCLPERFFRNSMGDRGLIVSKHHGQTFLLRAQNGYLLRKLFGELSLGGFSNFATYSMKQELPGNDSASSYDNFGNST